jgi:integrase
MTDHRRLTDRTLDALKPAPAGKRIDIWDVAVPGFGVRITDRGHLSFCIYGRVKGTPARLRLGDYPAMKLAAAREKARAWLEMLGRGLDPREVAKEELEAKAAAARKRQADNFAVVAEQFAKRHLKGLRSGEETKRLIEREFTARWRDRAISEITRREVAEALDAIIDRGTSYMANRALAHLRRLFNWALDRGIIEASPCARMRPPAKEKPRQRVLTDAELRALWRALDKLGYPFGGAVRLLLLTGARRDEVAEATWPEFSIAGDKPVWTIPAARYKTERAHIVPLGAQAKAILEKLPRSRKAVYVFSTTGGKKPASGYSKAKARLDAEMLRLIRKVARKAKSDPAAVTLEPWRLHDIRRTVRTRLSRHASEVVAERIIGHAPRGLARVYDQYEYLDERRAALEAWAAELAAIVNTPMPASA